MRLYVGSRDYKPLGYLTVDIDSRHNPDIVADITNMHQISDLSCDEIVASHVLEHISWPDSFKAISEFSRVLKIGGTLKVAIPDVLALLDRIKSGTSDFWAMGLIYGVGGRENDLEVHRYGFTSDMLGQILRFLGFDKFEWWNSKEADASNGWMPLDEDHKTAISLNVACRKVENPKYPPDQIFQELLRSPLQGLDSAVSSVAVRMGFSQVPYLKDDIKLYQDIHFKLIEANQRIIHLESELLNLRKKI